MMLYPALTTQLSFNAWKNISVLAVALCGCLLISVGFTWYYSLAFEEERVIAQRASIVLGHNKVTIGVIGGQLGCPKTN